MPSSFKYIVKRLLRILVGYGAASIVAALLIVTITAVMDPNEPDSFVEFAKIVAGVSILTSIFAAVPVIPVIALAEWRRIRNPAYFFAGGVLVSLCVILIFSRGTVFLEELGLVLPFCAVGGIAGLTYWSVTVRPRARNRRELKEID